MGRKGRSDGSVVLACFTCAMFVGQEDMAIAFAILIILIILAVEVMHSLCYTLLLMPGALGLFWEACVCALLLMCLCIPVDLWNRPSVPSGIVISTAVGKVSMGPWSTCCCNSYQFLAL